MHSFFKWWYLFPKHIILLLFGLVICGLLFNIYILKGLPSPKSLTSQPISLTTHIRDRNGVVLYKIYKNQNRTLIKLSDIPESLRQSVINIEDKDFYNHQGYSLSGIFRSFKNLISTGQVQGGSTVTQQLVKTSLLSPERTLRRKIRELILSVAVEVIYSKDQILEMYLNRISFGGATYGVEEAAFTYFGKSARNLNLSESAFLAGLIASPTTYSPFGSHPELAKYRQQEVLSQLIKVGYIDESTAASFSALPLNIRSPNQDIQAPHFVMYIKELLSSKYGINLLEQGGLDVTTSLDINVQKIAEQIVADETAKIGYLNVSNGAALITNPQTGEILGMVGSRNYFDTKGGGNVNLTLAPRQPGSSIKPVTYSLAFSRGFTPPSLIDDSPITYRIPGSTSYTPQNYDNRYRGQVTLRTALASSYNVPAVKLLAAIGPDKMASLGQKMGITTWNDPSRFGLSLTLGSNEVTMLDLSTVYGVFATNGLRISPQPILSIRNSSGKIIYRSKTISEPVLDSKVTSTISDILSDNTARTPTFGQYSDLVIPNFQVAVKTGTTNSLRDNWTIGYTPNLLVAVWVGNNDNSPMSYIASGVTGASPIWHKIMSTLLPNFPITKFILPPKEIGHDKLLNNTKL